MKKSRGLDGRVISFYPTYLRGQINCACNKTGKIHIYLKTELLTNSHMTKKELDGLPQLTPHLVGGHEERGGDSKLQFKDDLAQSNKNIPEQQLLDQRERESRSGEGEQIL